MTPWSCHGALDPAAATARAGIPTATLSGDTADGATGVIAFEDSAATRNSNGTYSRPGDADYNDTCFQMNWFQYLG